jgi:hypothetical protein
MMRYICGNIMSTPVEYESIHSVAGEKYLGGRYNFHRGPWVAGPYGEAQYPVSAEQFEGNCQLLVHTLYHERFGVQLPVGMWSQELYTDTEYFRFLDPAEELLAEGDIFFFGKQTEAIDLRTLHVAYNTGTSDAQGNPLLIHATPYNGEGVTVWPLPQFFSRKPDGSPQFCRYQHLFGIKRLQQDLYSIFRASQ